MEEAITELIPDEPRTALLDLNEVDSPRLPVVLGDETYYMRGKYDMSMADREELRLILVQVAEMQDIADEQKRNRALSKAERQVMLDLEIRMCALALPDCPEKILRDEKIMTAGRRKKLTDVFFEEVDVAEVVRSFAATLQRMQQQMRGKTPTPLQPLKSSTGNAPLPPQALLGPRPLPTTTESAPPTRKSRRGSAKSSTA